LKVQNIFAGGTYNKVICLQNKKTWQWYQICIQFFHFEANWWTTIGGQNYSFHMKHFVQWNLWTDMDLCSLYYFFQL
jgi:hypothetical protein